MVKGGRGDSRAHRPTFTVAGEKGRKAPGHRYPPPSALVAGRRVGRAAVRAYGPHYCKLWVVLYRLSL